LPKEKQLNLERFNFIFQSDKLSTGVEML